jgi:hypothetical protein
MVIRLILPRILSLSPVPHQTPRELAFCEVECAKDAPVCQEKTELAMLWLIIQRHNICLDWSGLPTVTHAPQTSE